MILYLNLLFCFVFNIACPHVNSYKRLHRIRNFIQLVAYGLNSRIPPIRIVQDNGVSNRLEFRLSDPSVNPYLLYAALMAAGMDGIEKKIEPDPKLNLVDDLWDKSTPEGIDTLPKYLMEALNYLKQDRVLVESIGEDVVNGFIAKKKALWDDYIKEVTKWEESFLESY